MPTSIKGSDRRIPSRAGVLLLIVFAAGGCMRGVTVPADQRIDAYDDGAYRAVLAAAVRDGRVDYEKLRRELTGPLHVYLDAVARFGPRSRPQMFPTEADRLAYYLNAHNALVLQMWLDHGAGQPGAPTQVRPHWFVLENWPVDGKRRSLRDLEQDVIRKASDDWRLPFALVRGSMDDPPLLQEPYEARRLDEQLNTQVKRWISDPDQVFVDNQGRLHLPSVLRDYRGPLKKVGGIPGVLERYLDPGDARRAPAIRAAVAGDIVWSRPDRRINDLRR